MGDWFLHRPIARNRKSLAGCQVTGYALAQHLGFDRSDGARWQEADYDRRWHELVILRWGLVPGWADDLAIGNRMINARSDSVAEKPAFRNVFKKRRCLVLAEGFYEWQKTGEAKQPYFFHIKGCKPFCFAGLLERWTKGEKPVETCTILTTDANKLMAPIHDRMPALSRRGATTCGSTLQCKSLSGFSRCCGRSPRRRWKRIR